MTNTTHPARRLRHGDRPTEPLTFPAELHPGHATPKMNALIDAAEERAKLYDGDDRDCIKADVMNAFFAGAEYADRAARPVANKAEVEPVGYVNGDELDNMLDDRTATIQSTRSGWRATPLYATPPATTGASTVLTDERIDAIWYDETSPDLESLDDIRRNYARAIEREVAAQAGQVAVPEEYWETAAQDVIEERRRQVTQEGWSALNDDKYVKEELRWAALCYMRAKDITRPGITPCSWPWAENWWKPADDRRNLVKAAALILAEIDRLDRAAPSPAKESLEPNQVQTIAERIKNTAGLPAKE